MKPAWRWRAVFVFTSLLALSSAGAAETDTQRIARQFREYCLAESTDHGERLLDDVELPKTSVSQAMRLLGSLRPDGSWADIAYDNGAASSWPAYDHLTRVLSIVVQARRTETPADQSAQCIDGAHRALAYWIQHDFHCPNWWYNDIGVPKILGNIALLLNDDLQPPERQYITDTAMIRSKVGAMTGQNRVWLAGNGVMLGALKNDDALVRAAAAVIQDEIRISTAEGIQPDWSFHQHGPQQQFGNYGMACAVDLARWASVLRGTRFALSEDKLAIIRNYLLQGENWVAWRGTMDISACGRQLFPNSMRYKIGVLCGVMRTMTVVDPPHSTDYQAFVSRNADDAANDLVGNRCFWRSDYLVHRRSDWAVTLKMYSDRVIGGESLNGENLSGAHLADGATYFYRTGHEYDDIFPVWDWRKIPGTTGIQTNASVEWPKKLGKSDPLPGTSFVGGVSDGATGCAAMDFRRDGIQAKKAWFFTGDLAICLGADINSSSKSRITTAIDQCLLRGSVTVQTSGIQTIFSGPPRQIIGPGWVEHNGFRYSFPIRQSITISAQPETGNWRTVFSTPSTPKANVTKAVFSLCLDHGTAPHDDTYAYYVSPAGQAPSQVKILLNSAQLQAVQVGQNMAMAVFWNAGSAGLGRFPITVDQPCLLLLDSSANVNHLTLADPTHQLKTLRLTIGGRARRIDLPQGDDAGKSVTLTIGG